MHGQRLLPARALTARPSHLRVWLPYRPSRAQQGRCRVVEGPTLPHPCLLRPRGDRDRTVRSLTSWIAAIATAPRQQRGSHSNNRLQARCPRLPPRPRLQRLAGAPLSLPPRQEGVGPALQAQPLCQSRPLSIATALRGQVRTREPSTVRTTALELQGMMCATGCGSGLPSHARECLIPLAMEHHFLVSSGFSRASTNLLNSIANARNRNSSLSCLFRVFFSRFPP